MLEAIAAIVVTGILIVAAVYMLRYLLGDFKGL